MHQPLQGHPVVCEPAELQLTKEQLLLQKDLVVYLHFGGNKNKCGKGKKMRKPPLAGLGCLVPCADHGEAEHWSFPVGSEWLWFAMLGYRTLRREPEPAAKACCAGDGV